MALNIDEKDLFREILAHEGWPVLMKVIRERLDVQTRRVLDFDLNNRTFEELGLEKARLEGAKNLVAAIEKLKTGGPRTKSKK